MLALAPVLTLNLVLLVVMGGGEDAEIPTYNRDVRPILAAHCFPCHGPDPSGRKAGLRLDNREGALRTRKGVRPVVVGKPGESELIKRVMAADPDERMPPQETGKSLTPEQIATLQEWIKGGASYERHWSFVPPRRPPLPVVRAKGRVRNGIDRFAFARLAREGLAIDNCIFA